jgi:hypothetical protein
MASAVNGIAPEGGRRFDPYHVSQINKERNSLVAQLVERQAVNLDVVGS